MRHFYALFIASICVVSLHLCATTSEIETLIEQYSKNDKGWPALHVAITQNREDVALEILRRSPEQSSLKVPQELGRANPTVPFVVKFLKYDPNEVLILSPLYLAIDYGHLQVAQELLNLGVNINNFICVASYNDGIAFEFGHYYENVILNFYTPLGQAVKNGNIEMTALLLKQNPNTDYITRFFKGFPRYKITGQKETFSDFHVNETWHKSLLGMIRNSPHAHLIDTFYRLLVCHLLDNKLTLEEIPQEVIELCKKWNDGWSILTSAINGGESESNIALLRQYGFN